MILAMEHDLLVTGADRAFCEQRVRLFFAKSQLVHYDEIDIDQERSVNAADPRFTVNLEAAIAENRRVLADLLERLKSEGCREIDDLLTLPQGFQSKMLHTMSHLLDGFFGIDSRMFDIDEISHWLTDHRRQAMAENPGQCWLIRVRARLVSGEGFEQSGN